MQWWKLVVITNTASWRVANLSFSDVWIISFSSRISITTRFFTDISHQSINYVQLEPFHIDFPFHRLMKSQWSHLILLNNVDSIQMIMYLGNQLDMNFSPRKSITASFSNNISHQSVKQFSAWTISPSHA